MVQKMRLFITQTLIQFRKRTYMVKLGTKKSMLRIRPNKKRLRGGGMFYAVFLAPKVKNCTTSNKGVILEVKNSFNAFNDAKRILDRIQHLSVLESKKKIVAKIGKKMMVVLWFHQKSENRKVIIQLKVNKVKLVRWKRSNLKKMTLFLMNRK